MRITNNMMVNNMINSMGKNLVRMDKFQQQMATGKKIQKPSDDPVVAARALKLRTDVAKLEQYKKNIQDAQSWMEYTDSALDQIGNVVKRARELAVRGASGTCTSDDLAKISEEIKQLKSELIELSNSSYAGRYIFSGFYTNQKLLNEDGAFALNVDNSQSIKYEIGVGNDININITGSELFNNGINTNSGDKGKMISNFEMIQAAMESGDNTAVSDAIELMDDNMDNVLRVRTDIGARMNRLKLTSNRIQEDTVNMKRLMSQNEDIDIAETVMKLKNEENVYKASLAGGAKIIQPTLVDFIR